MKRYLGRIFLCVIPVLVSIVLVVYAGYKYANGEPGLCSFRLGVDLSDGTILVYETDLSKMTEQARQDLINHPEQLAASLKHRIDPADLYNATIRPVPGDPPRVEIILPTGGRQQARAAEAAWQAVLDKVKAEYPDLNISYSDILQGQFAELIRRVTDARPKYKPGSKDNEGHDVSGKDVPIPAIADFIHSLEPKGNERRAFSGEEIEDIKNLIQQQGRLEFRILANSYDGTHDDGAAIAAAKDYIHTHQKEMDDLNALGKPPPPPTQNGVESGPRSFDVALNGDTIRYQYSWVEVGKEQLYSLQLNSGAEKTGEDDHRRELGRQEIWRLVHEADGKDALLSPGNGGILLYPARSSVRGRIASRRATAKWASSTKFSS